MDILYLFALESDKLRFLAVPSQNESCLRPLTQTPAVAYILAKDFDECPTGSNYNPFILQFQESLALNLDVTTSKLAVLV